jgi:hypothetical protein
MTEFDLDLRNAEAKLEGDGDGDGHSEIVLGVLDGSTDPDEWIRTVEDGKTLVLHVEGDLNRLAAGFAREIREGGGTLMRFRGFLVVTPPGVGIDTDRLP